MSFREFLITRVSELRKLKHIYETQISKWKRIREERNNTIINTIKNEITGVTRRCNKNILIREHKASECTSKIYEIQNWLSQKRKKETTCKTS